MTSEIIVGDVCDLPFLDGEFDLVFGSPPYCDARTYGIGAQRACGPWVSWMLNATTEALRVCKGPVVWVAAGVTRKRNYWPACEGLMWEWYKQGGQAYRPCIYHRVGIPGSGGDQWFRSDTEYVMCFKREGKLPWTDNTAMGHPPKWAPGGEISHRVSDGTRRNQWGGSISANDNRRTGTRRANGLKDKRFRPSHRQHTKTRADGTMEVQTYRPPVKANPGNVVKLNVGGGLMGSKLAHENEAPFPEKLAEWFILSLCPAGGKVLDPFSGSGTTVAVASAHGRHGVGVDIRQSQADLGKRRCEMVRKRIANLEPEPVAADLPGQIEMEFGEPT